MPPSDPDLNKTLAEYLEDDKDNKRKGYTLPNLFLEMQDFRKELKKTNHRIDRLEDDIDERFEERDSKIEHTHERLDAHRGAIVSIKRRLRHGHSPEADKGEEFEAEMDTGQFDVAAIHREVSDLKRKRLDSERVKAEETLWWKRSIVRIVFAAFAFVITTTLTVLITRAALGPEPPRPQSLGGK